MKHKRTIRYLGVDPTTAKNGEDVQLKYYAVNVEGRAAKLYDNAFWMLCKLTKDQLVFLFFLMHYANDDSTFIFGKPARLCFANFSKKAIGKTFAARTVARWIKIFTENQIVFRQTKGRGRYMLSPVFFAIEKDQTYNERERELRKSLEKPIANFARKVRAEALADKELRGILKDVLLPVP